MKTTKENAFFEELSASLDSREYERVKSRMRIAEKMADALKEKGLTQKEFAYKLGEKPYEVSRWLTGTMNLTHDTMYDIRSVLGIELMNSDNLHLSLIPRNAIAQIGKIDIHSIKT